MEGGSGDVVERIVGTIYEEIGKLAKRRVHYGELEKRLRQK